MLWGLSYATIGQLLLAGLVTGCIYALVAVGFNVLYRSMGMLNFAQGEFVILGGFAMYTLTTQGLPLALAVVLSLVVVAVFALLVQRTVIRFSRGEGLIGRGIATIGVSLLVVAGTSAIWGVDPLRVPEFTPGAAWSLGGVVLARQQAWIVGISLLAVLSLHLFFTRTYFGTAMRAASMGREAVEAVGVSVSRVNGTAWMVSGMVAGVAGVLVTPLTGVSFGMGLTFTLKGIAAAILGGMGSMVGAIIGGLLIGMFESISTGFMNSGWQDAVPMLILLLVLGLRPRGLLGARVDRV